MSDSELWTKVTSEQKEQAYSIYKKWLIIAKSTERINYQKATDAIKFAYLAIKSKKVPEISFVDSPKAALKKAQARDDYRQQSSFGIYDIIRRKLVFEPRNSIKYQLSNLPQTSIEQNEQEFLSGGWSIAQLQLFSRISIQFWSRYAWFLDFAYSVLGCYHISERWKALQLLVKNCGYILPFNDICYISDRPIELSFKDNDNLILHAENKPAVLFRDGYKIFVFNGIELSISI
ncbi:MAG: hypothetical protein QNJ55_22300 [Xenococcus sp. MO_188.B8]|nr:hypothetical protein [Xenococcus sp. MO_188.B8]